MRIRGIALALALGAGSLVAQEDEGIEVSEDPPEKPKTIEEAVRDALARLRRYNAPKHPKHLEDRQRVATEALVLYTRAVCADLRKEDRESLTAWSKEWKRGEQHEGFENPIDLAAVILALATANGDPKGKTSSPSENPNRPPRGSRFDKEHWDLMRACVVHLTIDGALRQDMDGGWGTTEDRLATTHFVLLALREATRAGYPVEPKTFTQALGYLRKTGNNRGVYRDQANFGDDVGDQARGMVSAWICHEQIALADPKDTHLRLSRELAERTALLDPVFRDAAVPPTIECLWAMEQLGSLTGQAVLGGRDWYREGTNRVLRAKWLAKDPETPEEVFSTCFAVLFLKRQTAPLAAGK